MIQKNTAVSRQCCLSMVTNLSKIYKSNISVSITGIAGPTGASQGKPVGLVFVGIKKGTKIMIKKFQFKNKGRIYIQRNTVKKTLKLIIDFL